MSQRPRKKVADDMMDVEVPRTKHWPMIKFLLWSVVGKDEFAEIFNLWQAVL